MDDVAELRTEAARTPVHGVWARGGPVFSRLSDDTVHGLEGRTIATFGDAATLGFWAFAPGIFAFYGGSAMLVNTAWQRTMLPIGGKA